MIGEKKSFAAERGLFYAACAAVFFITFMRGYFPPWFPRTSQRLAAPAPTYNNAPAEAPAPRPTRPRQSVPSVPKHESPVIPISPVGGAQDGLELVLHECTYENENVRCHGLVTSRNELSQVVDAKDNASAVDDEGNSYRLGRFGCLYCFSDGGRQKLLPNTPVKFTLKINRVPPSVKKMTFDLITGWGDRKTLTFVFSDVPIHK